MAEVRRFLQRLLALVRSGRAEADLAHEIDAHLQLLQDGFIAQGMSADDARYAARRAFGGVEQAKEHQRDARSFRSIESWWLDCKLGARMLIKYPGLTLIGGLGMAVAIAVSAASFAFLYASLHPTLPLDEGDRIVGLENWDTSWNNQEDRNLHDFVSWRQELKSVQDLSAYATMQRNLITTAGRNETVTVAAITASGFRVARVPPLMGRLLVDADEQPGAAAVAVIGYELWQRRFGSDSGALGQTVRLGGATHTIVGVMPEGFAFPVNHRLWVPLTANPADYARRRGPLLTMFGRLAPGVTVDDAQAELAILGQQAANAFPETHARLRPRVVRYTELWFDDGARAEMHGVQTLITLLVVVVGVNVAILVYARTATRQGEIAVRSALGATRGRIVAQLFAEALVLSSASAVLGLVLARGALDRADAAARLFGSMVGGIPFWMSFKLSAGTILYTVALAILAAVLSGIVPALKATGRHLRSPLQQLGGGSGLRLGRTWTALVVAQVAFAVALLPAAINIASQSIRLALSQPGFATNAFLVGRPLMDRDTFPTSDAETYSSEFNQRYRDRLQQLIARLEAQPEVADLTVMSRAPGAESTTRIALADGTGPGSVLSVGINRVSPDFFDAFGVLTLAGRRFVPEDARDRRIMVNRTFVQQVLGGGNPLGRRLRFVDPESESEQPPAEHEIVGVVEDFPSRPLSIEGTGATMYLPAASDDYGALLAIRLRSGDADAFTARFHEIATAIDPTLRLSGVKSLTDVYYQEQIGMHWSAFGLGLVTLSVVLLSAAGIYALMSVTVTRQQKEIGIRIALGADRGNILRSIFKRAFLQVGAGVVLGLAASALLDTAINGELMGGHSVIILPVVSVFMIAVGLAATFEPARRGLRIDPTEALKAE